MWSKEYKEEVNKVRIKEFLKAYILLGIVGFIIGLSNDYFRKIGQSEGMSLILNCSLPDSTVDSEFLEKDAE